MDQLETTDNTQGTTEPTAYWYRASTVQDHWCLEDIFILVQIGTAPRKCKKKLLFLSFLIYSLLHHLFSVFCGNSQWLCLGSQVRWPRSWAFQSLVPLTSSPGKAGKSHRFWLQMVADGSRVILEQPNPKWIWSGGYVFWQFLTLYDLCNATHWPIFWHFVWVHCYPTVDTYPGSMFSHVSPCQF